MSYPPGPPAGPEPSEPSGPLPPSDRPAEPPAGQQGEQPPGPEEPQTGYGQPPGHYPPPAYGQQPYGGTPPGPAAVTPTNQKATAALVTGITTLVLSWCCGLGVVGVVAIVLGTKARAEIRRSGGAESGDGIAVAGIVTGAVAVVIGLVVAVAMVLVIVSGRAAFQDYGTTY